MWKQKNVNFFFFSSVCLQRHEMSEGLKRESEEWRSDNQLLTTKFEFFSSVRTLATTMLLHGEVTTKRGIEPGFVLKNSLCQTPSKAHEREG
jgi:hypothetical protein